MFCLHTQNAVLRAGFLRCWSVLFASDALSTLTGRAILTTWPFRHRNKNKGTRTVHESNGLRPKSQRFAVTLIAICSLIVFGEIRTFRYRSRNRRRVRQGPLANATPAVRCRLETGRFTRFGSRVLRDVFNVRFLTPLPPPGPTSRLSAE